jgi:hypothetical protein
MLQQQLTEYGLKLIGYIQITNDAFVIDFVDRETIQLEECIYGLATSDEILRFGSSMAPLKFRLAEWQRDVTKALRDRSSEKPTPQREAEVWRKKLSPGPGLVYARQGTIVTMPIGTFNCYVAEERVLNERHRPILSRRV